jgi:peptide/nickel transport system substrate-binding protein
MQRCAKNCPKASRVPARGVVQRLPTVWRGLASCLRLGLIGLVCLSVLTTPALAAEKTPRPGGTLKIAWVGEPPTLDIHKSTTTSTRRLAWHMFERLFTFDQQYNLIPELAEGYDIAPDGKTYTVRIRQGVLFHNGKELTSDDVVASLKRWMDNDPIAKNYLLPDLDTLQATGPYSLAIRLKEQNGAVIDFLASIAQGPVIYPKEVVEAAGKDQIKSFIGTGPYQFVEYLPDRHIRLKRFDKYSARSEPPNGYGGKRVAYVDELIFYPVADVAVRAAGVEAGDFDVAIEVSADEYDRFANHPLVDPVIAGPAAYVVFVPNKKSPLMGQKKIRQALLAAIDVEPLMQVAFGNARFYRLDCSILMRETTWWSQSGCELYNQKNTQKAAQLLQEAGYDGTPVRWITTQVYAQMYKTSVAVKPQLEKAGLKVDLQVLDWAALSKKRYEADFYDVFVTYFTYRPSPVLFYTVLAKTWAGFWDNPEKDRLIVDMLRTTDTKQQMALWDELQKLIYDDVPFVRTGDFFDLNLKRKRVQNLSAMPETFFWNVWIDK